MVMYDQPGLTGSCIPSICTNSQIDACRDREIQSRLHQAPRCKVLRLGAEPANGLSSFSVLAGTYTMWYSLVLVPSITMLES